jgi:hypothetical protein
MTHNTNARVAGLVFLLYIGTGITIMVLSGQATGPIEAGRFASIAQHASLVRLNVVLGLLTTMCALVLGVTLYGLTRDLDPELALLALSCRIGEGVLGVIPILSSLGLLWLSTTTDSSVTDAGVSKALGDFAFSVSGWTTTISATFFAVGSTLFSYLFLRGRLVPILLAGLGVVASVLLVVGLPLQLAGLLSGTIAALIWLPMALFEVPLGFWLLIKGVAAPKSR